MVPFRITVGDYLGPDWVDSISLVDFVCMCPSLVSDLPDLLGRRLAIYWNSLIEVEELAV